MHFGIRRCTSCMRIGRTDLATAFKPRVIRALSDRLFNILHLGLQFSSGAPHPPSPSEKAASEKAAVRRRLVPIDYRRCVRRHLS